MTFEPTGSDRRAELIDVIHRVRNRWRLKLALRGTVIVVAGTLLALFLSASSLEALRFSPTAIITLPSPTPDTIQAFAAAVISHRCCGFAATPIRRSSAHARQWPWRSECHIP
jgi:hypothetical protein